MRTKTNVKELNIKERINICRQCPICNLEDFICSGYMYLNPDTNEASLQPKPGFIKGCGCVLSFKTKDPNKHCPAKKW